MNTLAFATSDQVVLFEMEIQGQLSDGHWENTRPLDHWKPWCGAGRALSVIVDPDNVGRDFHARKDNYNLVNGELLEIIGKRMERYVRLARHFGPKNARVLESALDLDGDFRGAPDYEGDYWNKVRNNLSTFDMVEVQRVVEDESSYGRKELLADLRAMKVAMRSFRK